MKLFERPRTKQLLKDMEQAEHYQDWAEMAAAWDEEHGLDEWKQNDACESYDYRSIRQRLDKVRDLRFRREYHDLLFVLNEGLHGNLGGMGKPALYNKAKLGTKNLITRYVEEICGALDDLNEVDDSIIALEEKQDFFLRASHCYGRSALMLSGGAVLGFFHAGVVKVCCPRSFPAPALGRSSLQLLARMWMMSSSTG